MNQEAHTSLYLKNNIQVEPLIDHWYAWPYLIPPATAARNLTERHLPIMDSFIKAPSFHTDAVKNPKMLGGPFVAHSEESVGRILELREAIADRRKPLIELSRGLQELDSMLKEQPRGYSLEQAYALVPECLKGLVELTYDLNHNASFRLIEPLLYRSQFFFRDMQSLMLSEIGNDDRPFILSTPRLETDGSYHWRKTFADEAVDKLFKLKTESACWQDIQELLDVPDSSSALVRSFFTEHRPAPYKTYEGNGVRWRYFGHACILVEAAGIAILFDPVLSYTYESDISRFTYEDLPPRIDFVLITHNHQDHVLFETLLQLRSRIDCIVVPRNGGGHLQDPSLKLILEATGFSNVIEISELCSFEQSGLTVTAVPFLGEHGDLDIQTKSAWHIRVDKHSMLFAADSCNLEPRMYSFVRNVIGEVDALFIGMECDGAPLNWLYGPLFMGGLDRTMSRSRRGSGSNFEQGIDIVRQFDCKEVYVYAMGQEPWLNYIMSIKYTEQSKPIVESNRLIETAMSEGRHAERLFGEKEILAD